MLSKNELYAQYGTERDKTKACFKALEEVLIMSVKLNWKETNFEFEQYLSNSYNMSYYTEQLNLLGYEYKHYKSNNTTLKILLDGDI